MVTGLQPLWVWRRLIWKSSWGPAKLAFFSWAWRTVVGPSSCHHSDVGQPAQNPVKRIVADTSSRRIVADSIAAWSECLSRQVTAISLPAVPRRWQFN